MAETIDDLTVEYREGDQLTVKELDKIVLTKGAWSTIVFKYQDLNRGTGEYGAEKYTIRRYQKRNGVFRQQSKFNISSRDQAKKIIDALQTWLDQDPE